MSELVVSDAGERELLRINLKAVLETPRIWYLRLYTNNYTPNRDTEITDLVEAVYTDYAPVPIDPAQWSDPVTVAGVAVSYWGIGFTQFAPPPIGTTVYGYFLTFNDPAELLWSQIFDQPVIGDGVQQPVVWPNLNGHSESQPPPPPPPPGP